MTRATGSRMSEWIQRKSTYKTSAMYVSAGYRVKQFTPYLTYAQNSQGSFLPDFPAAFRGSGPYWLPGRSARPVSGCAGTS